MEEREFANMIKGIIFGIFAIVLIFSSFGIVDSNEIGVKTRLGNVIGTVGTGPYLKLPFVDTVHKVDMKTRIIKNEYYVNESGKVVSNNPLEAASKDLQDVKVSTVMNYKLSPEKAVDIVVKYGSEEAFEEGVLKPIIKQEVKSVTSQYTAEELVTKRVEYNDKVSSNLIAIASGKGAVIEQTNVTNITFTESFNQAIEAKVTAQQNALKAENDLSRIKFEAEQRIATAKAEAEAIRIQAQAINSQGGADYVELKRIEKWNGLGCTSYCGLEASTGLLINK